MPALLNKNQLNKISDSMKKLSGGNVLIVGDIILDEFIVGSPERISREAPVIILEHLSSEFALGGASNAAHNIAALGAKCTLIGIAGNDLYSKALKNECMKLNIDPVLIIDEERPTTVKTRILSISHKHPTSSILFKQQILRLDRLSKKTINKKIEAELINKFDVYIKQCAVVLISDYDLGVCSDRYINHIIKKSASLKIPVVVDAPKNFSRFKGAHLITPNQPDAEDAVNFTITDKPSLIKAGKKLLTISGTNNVLITRGSEGMVLFNDLSPESPIILTAFNVSEVFDVTGAGDTVAGTIACALSGDVPIESACIIANLAASLVVKKYGTAVTSINELKENLESIK